MAMGASGCHGTASTCSNVTVACSGVLYVLMKSSLALYRDATCISMFS